jgi:integrase
VVRWRETDGKQREKSYPHDRKTVANDFAKKAEGDKIQGVRTVVSSVTFGDYAKMWITTRPMAATTRTRYMGVLTNHLGCISGRKLAHVAKDRDGIAELLLVTLPAKGLGRAQVELCQVVIVSTMLRAMEAEKITGHNLSRIKLPAKDETVDDELISSATNAKITAVAAAMPPEWSLAVWLARGLGLRNGEVRAVKLADFSADMKSITIRRQVETGTTVKALKARKSGDGRTIPVPALIAEKVREHVAAHGTRDGYLLGGKRTAFIPESSFNAAWTAAKKAAGMPAGFRFHDLRHVYATRMIDNGIDSADVSGWLGHKSVDITRRIYVHFLPKTADRARAFLDADLATAA